MDREIERLCAERYPETELLRQVPGVGAITALYFVLTIEDPSSLREESLGGRVRGPSSPAVTTRASSVRSFGSRRRGTGCSEACWCAVRTTSSAPSVRTRIFDEPGFGWRSEAARRRRSARSWRRRRRLAVLLHRLWVTGEVYEPLRERGFAGGVAKRARNHEPRVRVTAL